MSTANSYELEFYKHVVINDSFSVLKSLSSTINLLSVAVYKTRTILKIAGTIELGPCLFYLLFFVQQF